VKTVTLHYRWHPFFGLTLRVLRQQKYGDRVCLVCEGPSGTSSSFPSWMCSPESSGFILGAPQISVEALLELRLLLDTLQVSSACDTASRVSSSKEGADENVRGQAGSRTDKTAPARASSKPAIPADKQKELACALMELLLNAAQEYLPNASETDNGGKLDESSQAHA
jgi:hypothetical protein